MCSALSAGCPRPERAAGPFEKLRDRAPDDPAFFEYGSIRAYLGSFPDARNAAADMRRRFKFPGVTGIWWFLASAARDITG